MALVLITCLAGLGGGYGLGYAIYQPQIRALESDMNNLNDRLALMNTTFMNGLNLLNSGLAGLNSTVVRIENVTFHHAFYVSGTGDTTTDDFPIRGDWVRIVWYMVGESSSSWIMIDIYYSNGTYYSSRGSSGLVSLLAGDLDIEKPNSEYYLNITTYGVTQYDVTIWDYY